MAKHNIFVEMDNIIERNNKMINWLEEHCKKLDQKIMDKALKACNVLGLPEAEPEQPKAIDYTIMLKKNTVVELKAKCREFKVKGYSKMKKDELIKVVAEAMINAPAEETEDEKVEDNLIIQGLNEAMGLDVEDDDDERDLSPRMMTNLVTGKHLEEVAKDEDGTEAVLFDDEQAWYKGIRYDQEDDFVRLVELQIFINKMQERRDFFQKILDDAKENRRRGGKGLPREKFDEVLKNKLAADKKRKEALNLQREHMNSMPANIKGGLWGRYFGECTNYMDSAYRVVTKKGEAYKVHTIATKEDEKATPRRVGKVYVFRLMAKQEFDVAKAYDILDAEIDYSPCNDPTDIDCQVELNQSQGEMMEVLEEAHEIEMEELTNEHVHPEDEVQTRTGGFVPACRTKNPKAFKIVTRNNRLTVEPAAIEEDISGLMDEADESFWAGVQEMQEMEMANISNVSVNEMVVEE